VPDILSRDTHALEGIVYVGWTVAVLAVAGLVALVLRRRWGMALVLGLGALIPILFALGGNLPGYHFIWEHVPGLRNTRVPERMMPIACLALAGLLAVAVSRLRWQGAAAAIVAVLLLVDLRMALFHQTAADPHNPVYTALRQQSPGRLLEFPVFEAGSQSASVYLYYLMQAPHQHPSGYSTTAPLAADRRLRVLQKTPCRYLRPLGVRELVTHYSAKNPCGGRLIARAGRIAAYRVR
jgi:peptidoglycan/LPS O-acetylase OafA/YrhL